MRNSAPCCEGRSGKICPHLHLPQNSRVHNKRRYPGFAPLMHSFGAIGLLEPSKPIVLDRWSSLARLALEQKFGLSLPVDDLQSLRSALATVLPTSRIPALLEALYWLHLIPSASSLTSTVSKQPVPGRPIPPVDALAQHLAYALRYAPHERDL